ncbi:HTTM domain-containing protein [Streptomyces sp. NBC_01803]|uniref:HTTM domain-containing protein n=1 Tax=Streptomyces sp. NBC_01803 TaxID=2975946 RepID=UPI002DD8AB30|nr:HTTM domain-containing protein [Streptomyces sp. NBC_01803]WSA43574.1 HTTM domain-containing protein [Streptomyces sp. NBC_01803]
MSATAADRDSRLLRPWLELAASRAFGPYQTAVVRIGVSFTFLLYLLREIPERHVLYGPDGPWGLDLAERALAMSHAFTVLMWNDSDLWFEFVYALGIASCVAMLVGWRTRTATVLVMVMIVSFQARNQHLIGGGDNILRLAAIYLVLTRCGQVWSLDARRLTRVKGKATAKDGSRDIDRVGIALWLISGAALAAATATGDLDGRGWTLGLWGMWALHGLWWALNRRGGVSEPRAIADMVANLLHNAALLILMAEVCLIYATAGWYKIQGSLWQEGTAVYYSMRLDYFSPWPEISERLASNSLMVLLMTYGTVMVQVAFPFSLLNRRLKNVLLVALIGEHIAIGILLALPFFSMAMIAADIVFLPTAFLLAVDGRVRGLFRRIPPPRAGAERETAQAEAAPPERQPA